MKSFVHFMFHPFNGFLVFLISVLAIAGLTLSAWFQQPYSFNAILGLYAMLLLALFTGSYLRYLNYRSKAPRELRWNSEKGRFESRFVIVIILFLLTSCQIDETGITKNTMVFVTIVALFVVSFIVACARDFFRK